MFHLIWIELCFVDNLFTKNEIWRADGCLICWQLKPFQLWVHLHTFANSFHSCSTRFIAKQAKPLFKYLMQTAAQYTNLPEGLLTYYVRKWWESSCSAIPWTSWNATHWMLRAASYAYGVASSGSMVHTSIKLRYPLGCLPSLFPNLSLPRIYTIQ